LYKDYETKTEIIMLRNVRNKFFNEKN